MIVVFTDPFTTVEDRLRRGRRNVFPGDLVEFWCWDFDRNLDFDIPLPSPRRGTGLVLRRSTLYLGESQGFSDVLIEDGRVLRISNVDISIIIFADCKEVNRRC